MKTTKGSWVCQLVDSNFLEIKLYIIIIGFLDFLINGFFMDKFKVGFADFIIEGQYCCHIWGFPIPIKLCQIKRT